MLESTFNQLNYFSIPKFSSYGAINLTGQASQAALSAQGLALVVTAIAIGILLYYSLQYYKSSPAHLSLVIDNPEPPVETSPLSRGMFGYNVVSRPISRSVPAKNSVNHLVEDAQLGALIHPERLIGAMWEARYTRAILLRLPLASSLLPLIELPAINIEELKSQVPKKSRIPSLEGGHFEDIPKRDPGVTMRDPIDSSIWLENGDLEDAVELGGKSLPCEGLTDNLCIAKLHKPSPKRKPDIWTKGRRLFSTGVQCITLKTDKKLPSASEHRPNLLSAIKRLRENVYLSSTVVAEVGDEINQRFKNMHFAAEGANTSSSIRIPKTDHPLVVMPAVLHGPIEHIVLFIFDKERNTLEYFDSQGRSILDRETKCLVNPPKESLFDCYCCILRELGNTATKVVENLEPIQSDVNNCGAHILQYAWDRAEGLSPEEAGRGDIWKFREKLDELLCESCQASPTELPTSPVPPESDTSPVPPESDKEWEAL